MKDEFNFGEMARLLPLLESFFYFPLLYYLTDMNINKNRRLRFFVGIQNFNLIENDKKPRFLKASFFLCFKIILKAFLTYLLGNLDI